MSPTPRPRANLAVLGALAVVVCCALPTLVAVAGTVGVGAVWGAWGLLGAGGIVAAAVLARRLGRQAGDRQGSKGASDRAARPSG